MRDIRKSPLIVIAALVALAATACGGGGSSTPPAAAPSGPVTLTWWHNATTDPLKSLWQQTANSYHSAHPNVSFQVDPIQNEQFLTKVPLALQSSDPPSLYQEWGGGREASEIPSGKVMDLTQQVSSWIGELGPVAKGWQVNGKQYGVPYDLHVVGFWYRKDLFTRAGITSPPTTLSDLESDVSKLKAAHIAPIAIGSKDRWPDAFYWDYFAVRECSVSTMQQQAGQTVKLTDPCWVKAGEDLKSFLAIQPFQTGFLGTPAQTGAGSSAGMIANGQAAMELQGDWESATMTPLTTDKSLSSKVGFFPFPSVPGGQGNPAVALGGGDGFACTTQATTACPDFLKYLDSAPIQTQIAATGSGLPANKQADSSITDPTLKQVLAYSNSTPYIQLYFDTSLPYTVGQQLDDAVANFFAGQGTPQSIVSSVENSSTGGK
jgi:raffinose/stachyose/melibiose transport system substrate-binding protein